MKIKLLLLIVIVNWCLGCSNKQPDSNTIIELIFYNAENQTLFIDGNGIDYKKKIKPNDSVVSFIDTLKIDGKGGYYSFYPNRTGFNIYLKKGINTKISLDLKDVINTIKFSKDLSDENNYLVSKEKITNKNLFEFPPDTFVKKLNSQKDTLFQLLQNGNISEEFKKMETREIEYYLTIKKILYPTVHERLTPNHGFTLPNDFYSELDKMNFNDTIAYKSSQTYKYSNMVRFYYEKKARDKKKQYNDSELLAFLKEIDKAFAKGFVKDDLLLTKMRMGMPLNSNLEKIYETYIGAFKNKKYLKMVDEEYHQLKKLKPGNTAPEFKLENHLGNFYQLNDFKDKNIYIDIWATWCGPCVAEMPALKKRAKEFPEIQFISISIDKEKHLKTWLKMVEKEQLPGIQLIAYNENKEFKDNYAVRAIPRYLLIGKNGNIISANTFPPSSSKLPELFEKLSKN